MPTVGFFELLLIGVVALLVLGPERLPGAIRTTSLWVGRARRSFNKVKSEIEQQLNADEIRRQLHNESILADLDEAKKKAKALADDTGRDLKILGADVDKTLKQIASSVQADQTPPNSPTSAELYSENPALLDEEPEPQTSPTELIPDSTVDAAPRVKAEQAPVEDFYNNPGVGVIELRDGVYKPAASRPAPAQDAENKDSVNK
jgi:sec-independent protein translocase protein TatB